MSLKGSFVPKINSNDRMRKRRRLRRFLIIFSQIFFFSRRVGGSPSSVGCVPHSKGPGSSTKVGCPEKRSIYANESGVVECNRGSVGCECSDPLACRVVPEIVEKFLE